MNVVIKWLMTLLALLLVSPLWGMVQDVDPAQLEPSAHHKQVALIITKVIERYHYKKSNLDDQLSGQVLDRFLETLDPNKSFFTAKDVKLFAIYRTRLDDHLRRGNLDPAFHIFKVYRERVQERVEIALKLVQRKFDFSIDELYQFNREDSPWAADQAALDELWRKRVKNDILSLRISGKPEDEIRTTLEKRYDGLARRVRQFNSDDIFQSFINAYTLSLEPHTSYMSPSSSANFDISMRLSLEGIGAVLKTDNEYTVVQKTITGGPAKLSGQVHSGDRIIGVGQGLDGAVEDVVGWRLQDVVEKIRGPKGSVVRLLLLPKDSGSDGPNHSVTLVRNQIKLEDQAAHKSIIEGLDNMAKVKIGVIEVPTFYRDFRAESSGDEDFRSTTRDVRLLIDELKAEGVNGIVIDLRQNGGGSLSEATELTGLFIDTGPVVQVKDSFGKVEVEEDPNSDIAYTGPLAVLVDRNSASASEIFAGAIQDYRRGIVIGEPTFGKGTVQTLVDLGRFVPDSNEDLGRLRLTMAQFFRINGGSTQHRGVVPDIVYPLASRSTQHGERGLDNALPWDRIQPARYAPGGIGALAPLRDFHSKRVKDNPGFLWLEGEERLLEKLEERKTVSLLESARRKEWDDREQQRLERENRFRKSMGLAPKSARKDDKEATDDDEEEDSEQKLTNGILLNEAARILADYIFSQPPRSAMQMTSSGLSR